ncbi:MAG: hypothetical protein WAJ93_13280 [Candidatus Nitrosopolaris sp.]
MKIHKMMSTVYEWTERSRKGEVCGVLGCRDTPTTQCPICGNHYCLRDLGSHGHIITDAEIEEQRKTTERLKYHNLVIKTY